LGVAAQQKPAWMTSGEVLAFDVSYKMGPLDIRAGRAELRLDPQSPEGYRLTARAWNLDGVRSLIQMRDRIVAEGTHQPPQMFLTHHYHVTLNENDYRADKVVTFDRVAATSTYTNRRAPAEPPKVQPLADYGRDLFSALYHLRATVLEPAPGNVYTLPVRELDRAMTLHVHVLGRGEIRTKAGRFKALHVQPVTQDGPEGRRKDRLHIWVTDDERRMPLRIEIRMALGAFTGELAGFGGLDAASRAPKDLPLTGEIRMQREALPHANPL
jgi:hypothetical protein